MQSQAKSASEALRRRARARIAGALLAVAAAPWLLAEPTPTHNAGSPTRAEAAYQAAQAAAAGSSNSVTCLWNLGRTAFDLADSLRLAKPKAKVAESGIAACRAAVRLEPASAPAHYYLALCLGQLAQTKTLGALRLVREIESELEQTRVLDESYDHAGPDRGLGLLYLEAPGWPTSIGDRPKARRHLEKAVQLAPGYPDNHLSLLEALLRAKDAPAATSALAALESAWRRARETLTGPDWVEAWTDWEARRQALAARAARLGGRR